MIKNIDDLKSKIDYWLNEGFSWAGSTAGDEEEIRELQRIISLINCDVVCETEAGRAFQREIDLNGIINILSCGGKIKKLSEVDFDE